MGEKEEVNSYQRLCIATGELLAHAGIMRAAFYSTEKTAELGARFDDKLDNISFNLLREVGEIQEFGAALDDFNNDGA